MGPYKSKWNALLAPIGALPLFFFRDWDIMLMSLLVFVQNLWAAWCQIDTANDDYTWATYYKDAATANAMMTNPMSWAQEKVASDAYETMSMLADPITAATSFGHMYR